MSADVRERIARVFAQTDALSIEPDLLQPAGPYVDLAGEDVRARLVRVADADGEELCLRPDLTIPVCRAHAARRSEGAGGPQAYRYDGLVYRFAGADDRRPIQTRQIGLERFADADPFDADLGVFKVAAEAVRAGRGRIDEVWVGDAGLFARFIDGAGLGAGLAERLKRAFQTPQGFFDRVARARRPSALATALAAVPAAEAAAALAEVYALAGVEAVGARSVQAITERLLDEAAETRSTTAAPEAVAAAERLAGVDAPLDEALDQIEAIARASSVDLSEPLAGWRRRAPRLVEGAEGGVVRFSVGLARQFDYYDGFVFELCDRRLGRARFLATGGRYDGLIERLGLGARESAVGCVARPDWVAASAEADR